MIVAHDLSADQATNCRLNQMDLRSLSTSFPKRQDSTNSSESLHHNIRTLESAGVPVLAGTDAPNPGTTHGASLHHELELLTSAGLTNAQALAAATSRAADCFRLSDRGRIKAGLRADLILVNGNPLQDIQATRNIAGVWKAGHEIDRSKRRESIVKGRDQTADKDKK